MAFTVHGFLCILTFKQNHACSNFNKLFFHEASASERSAVSYRVSLGVCAGSGPSPCNLSSAALLCLEDAHWITAGLAWATRTRLYALWPHRRETLSHNLPTQLADMQR